MKALRGVAVNIQVEAHGRNGLELKQNSFSGELFALTRVLLTWMSLYSPTHGKMASLPGNVQQAITSKKRQHRETAEPRCWCDCWLNSEEPVRANDNSISEIVTIAVSSSPFFDLKRTTSVNLDPI